ncbi:MAG TPA: hypothetical protein PLV68_21780, partial [Ilumatobacteraceae bacterium]|nr:hypothetical protein [Ilumatobacteraceae bacterium]
MVAALALGQHGFPLGVHAQHDRWKERHDVERAPLPVTGAWRPGDPVGHRQFLTIAVDHPMALDGGTTLTDIVVAYETWGTLNADASNAILVCHAWTGDSHLAGASGPGHVD